MSWSRRDLLLRGAALGGGALIAGCAPAGSSLDLAREAGIVTLGIANEAPYGFTGPGGTVTGQSVEVARAVFAALGIPEIRPVTVDFGELVAGLTLAHQFDVIAAGMFVTPTRCASVAFSVPDYTAPTAFLVPSGNPHGVATFDDVRDQTLRLAVLGGAEEYRYALDSGIPAPQIQQLADQQALLLAVEDGRADCAALTNVSLKNALAAAPGSSAEVTPGFFPVIGGRPVVSAGAFAVRPGDDDLLEGVNTQLRAMQRSGEWLRIAQPFGFGPDNVPGPDVTTESLCGGEAAG
jgi:polar amino acid transport system substrate-binding protein